MLRGVDSRNLRGHHGQSLVEFALILPVMAVLFLVFGAVLFSQGLRGLT